MSHDFAGVVIEDSGPTGKQLYVYFDVDELREFMATCPLTEATDPASLDLYARTTQGPVYEIIRFAGSLHGSGGQPLMDGKVAEILSLNWELCEYVASLGGGGLFEFRLPIPEQPNV